MTISSRFRLIRPFLVAACALLATGLGVKGAAAQGEVVTIRDLQLSANGLVLRAKSADITSPSVARATIETTLKSGDPAKLVEQLGSLGATAITFADFQLERTEGSVPKSLGFAKLVLTGISAGRIRSLQGNDGKWQVGTSQQSSFATLTASSLDARFLTRILGDLAEPADASEPLVASAVIERFESRPGGALWVTIQKIALNDVRVMPRGKSQFGALGAMELSDLKLPMPVNGAQASKGEIRLRSVTIGADKTGADDVPTRYRARLDDLAVPLLDTDPSPAIRNLRALGLDAIVGSASLEGNWSPAKRELSVERLGIAVQNLGSITLSGSLANVAPEIFTETGAVVHQHWAQALVKTMSVVIQNTGLYERAVARTAKNTGQPVEEVRKQVATASAQSIRQLTAGIADKTVPDALIRFFEAPRSLSISIQPKPGASLPFSALLARGGMATFTDKVQVKATTD